MKYLCWIMVTFWMACAVIFVVNERSTMGAGCCIAAALYLGYYATGVERE